MHPIFRGFNNLLHASPSQLGLTYKTYRNYLYALFKAKKATLPVEIQIEPSSVCNLKCKICNLSKSNEKTKFLKPTDLTRLIKQIKPLKSINFTGMGESLLNPDLITLIKIAHHHQIQTSLITNGQLLTRSISNKLVGEKVNAISFSIDSGNPTTYEQIRLGAKYETLINNIKYLVATNKIHKSPIKIIINVVLLKTNLTELSHIYKIIDLAKKIGIRYITFQNPNIMDHNFTNKTIKQKYRSILSYSKQNNISITLPEIKINKNCCYYPWIYPQITASGELLPCCIIPQFDQYQKIINNYSFGNIFSDNFINVWNSKKASIFRNSLKNNPSLYCQQCTKYQGRL